MSKHFSNSLPEATCREKCKFKEHGKIINSAITKVNISDYQLGCFINNICKNYGQVLDYEGRNALHVAASCGRRDLCWWLVKSGRADINCKDQESGYTPLHRSIFYGHLNNAVSFIEMGAQTQVMDKDDLQANDLAMKDRLVQKLSQNNPGQAYVWGTNNNYTLGMGNQHSRTNPELVDFFRKKNIPIKQVSIDKFHSVFVSATGQAWACGHGQGGRLGVGSEQTLLTPQLVKTGGEVVVRASVGRNHTILLMDSGNVWTCGSNANHVLGHSPPPPVLLTPRPIPPRLLPRDLVGVAAARYSSVLWSNNAVFTFGLNGGQLGHMLSQEKSVITPKLVKGFNQKNEIVDVAASIGATVVSLKKGEIYVFHNYQVRRIASKMLDVIKVDVFGGELNTEVDPKLSAKGGEELKVMALTLTGKVLFWQESFPQLTRCINPLKRSLTFCDLSLCRHHALLITQDGEAFLTQVKPKVKKKAVKQDSGSSPNTKDVFPKENLSFNQFMEKLDFHHMSITRVAHIHRAVSVSADPKGQNFVVIQENPKANLTDIPIVGDSEFDQQMANLLEDAHENDSLHDVIIEADHSRVAAHHFVLARSSEEFASLPRTGSIITVKLEGVQVQMLKQVLRFAYTQDCDIIHPGSLRTKLFDGDVIKAGYGIAKRLKMSVLTKCLQLLKFEDGFIRLKESGPMYTLSLARLERTMFPGLYDVTVASSDGATFKAHKCVLAAQLDYFNNMFCGGWIEAGASSSLSLPIPQVVLREVLDFLYRDEAPLLSESLDVDYISSVLVVADQLFIKRLKEICEAALCNNLSLRNAAYLLQLAYTYNADQLKSSCMQFVCLNLAAFLESRALEILDNSILEELSSYYRTMIPAMRRRIMKPSSTAVSDSDIIDTANSHPVNWLDSEDIDEENEHTLTKINKSAVMPITSKKKAKTRKTSESQRKRFESVSSNSDLDISVELTPIEKIDFDELVDRQPTNKKDEWVKVDKAQKTVQDRLKVILQASAIEPTPLNFTKLTRRTSQPTALPSIQDNSQFPQLSSPPNKLSSSPKSSSVEVKRSPVVKLSQKQRKKLLSEGMGSEEMCTPSEASSPPLRSPWASINTDKIDSSLADIMKSALAVGKRESEPGLVKFADIVAEEIEQRDNWSKMKCKSLQLTQIEDKAMEDLRFFYNAANTFDERITVERVLSANIAKPKWITSRRQ